MSSILTGTETPYDNGRRRPLKSALHAYVIREISPSGFPVSEMVLSTSTLKAAKRHATSNRKFLSSRLTISAPDGEILSVKDPAIGKRWMDAENLPY